MKNLILSLLIALSLTFAPMTVTSKTTPIGWEGHHVTVMLDEYVTSEDERHLRQLTSSKNLLSLHIVINNPGGKAYTMMGMLNAVEDLKARGVKVTTEISGMAASAAALMWLAGDVRIVRDASQIMFHKARLIGPFGPVDCEDAGPYSCFTLNNMNNFIRQFMLDTIGDTELVNDMLDEDENWYTGSELFKLGVATQKK